MRGRRFGFIFICSLILPIVSCSGGKDPWQERPGPKVLAYFPPLYSWAASIAGDDAQVRSLITHIGPHHFDPSTRDARTLQRADLFLTIGLGLDDGVTKKMTGTSGNKSLILRPLGELLPKESLREGGCECCKQNGEKHTHDHDHTDYDPHVWLGIPEAIRMVEGIRDDLIKLDAAHATGYSERAAKLIDRFKKLEEDGKSELASKGDKPKIISFHDSLFYFARSFGIEVVDSIQAPGQEPSPKKLNQIVESCKKNGVRLIAVEPQYPTHTSARVILEELKRNGIDAAFVEIDPLETADPADLTADYYERKMRENLAHLTTALK
jgi:ABC-type Zn uptake system ZnuABC Zn-binding protein ZnuA